MNGEVIKIPVKLHNSTFLVGYSIFKNRCNFPKVNSIDPDHPPYKRKAIQRISG
jgi:hypothetical protein